MTDEKAGEEDNQQSEGGVASAHLAGVAELARGQGSISIEEVLEALGPTSLAFAIVFLALPAMIPIPGPFGMVFGSMLALVALQIMAGSRSIWLPRFLRRRRLSASTIDVMIRHTAPLVSRVEGWMRPGRLKALTGRTALMLIGLPVFLLAVAVALPIPFGNILPVLSLTVIGAGLLERDGLATLIGIILATLSLGTSVGLVFGGAAAIAAVFT
ncbi:exopolysaccharide biosynthesis protein [Rhizobium sp. RU36D]|uniref:exopolysaccharide biosynthesis protein n=1 Tax=Rhizobium sp. RU36D TaxID=1907415 RepID=UPI0009D7A0BF|nr:exopolysaccharide biosynthesis protein [Rhizobium sp. RU36D]SMC99967.1 Uncharacterized conserved protein [Rhizobium sp. RU36D]